MVSSKVEMVVNYVVLTIFALAVVAPVTWLLLAASSPKANAGIDLAHLRPANFVDAWVQSDFGHHLINSLVICIGAVVLTTVVSILAGTG
jgi:ABC-type glycerol-3-phosphate transport system permease component